MSCIASGVMCGDVDPIKLDKQVLQLLLAAVVSIVTRCAPNTDTCHRNQPNKNKLVLTLTVILPYRYVVKNST